MEKGKTQRMRFLGQLILTKSQLHVTKSFNKTNSYNER